MRFSIWLQSRLTAHGFSPGPIDGDIGPLTLAALRAFERAHGLPANGTADERVVTLLRRSASALETPLGIDRDTDPDDVPVVASAWPRQRDTVRFYGEVGTNQTRIDLPFRMKLAWDKRHTIGRMTLHEKVADSASRCLERIADAYDERQRVELGLDLFGGSLNVRRMRGGSRYSMHSWGIAIDFDPGRNALRTRAPQARLSQADATTFWRIWEDEGWLSLGRARGFDWMHVQAARL